MKCIPANTQHTGSTYTHGYYYADDEERVSVYNSAIK